MTAVLFIENAQVEAGTVYVIPRTNHSAATHNDPQEAHPDTIRITWIPAPCVSSATVPAPPIRRPVAGPGCLRQLHGSEAVRSECRNINRCYPGKADGTLTEQMAYGVTQFIIAESIDMTIDLHEASPEYPTINTIVAHDRAMDLASFVAIDMQMEGIDISLERSPTTLRGLTHRELGDHTDTLALLMEAPNPAQGRLRGVTDEELIVTGQDDLYVRAAELGMLYVPFDEAAGLWRSAARATPPAF